MAAHAPEDLARMGIEAGRAHQGPAHGARAVAGAIRTDGAAVAAQLLLDAVGREAPPVSE